MKKIITVLTIMMLLLACMPLYSKAVSMGRKVDISFRASSTKVSKGDKITFEVILNAFPKTDGNEDVLLYGYGYCVHFDTNFFESFSNDASSKVEDGLYRVASGMNPTSVQTKFEDGEDAVISTFTLKVKQDTTLTSGEVYLTDDPDDETFSDGDTMTFLFLNERYPLTISLNNGGSEDPTPSTVSVTGISVNPTSKELTVGETLSIQATVTPSNATNKNVTWASSNTNVATVSSSGVVTAKAEGAATITAKTNDGNYTATSVITVKKAEEQPTESDVKVTGVALDKTTGTVKVGGKLQLTATVAPSNATNKNVTWSSSDTSIATVNTSGLVTGVKTGTAQITVKTVDGSKTAAATIVVTNEDIVIDIEDNKQSSGGSTSGGSSSKSGTDSTTAKGKIPQTGETFIVAAGIIALSSVAIVSYKKMKANKDIK